MKPALLLGVALVGMGGGCAKVGEPDPFSDLLFRKSRFIMDCGPEADAEIEAKVVWAHGACRDAWNTRPEHGGDDWGREAGRRMMDLKILFEAHRDSCYRDEASPDFWSHFQIWRPGDPWEWQWDWCFGTHPDRESMCMQ